MGQALPQRSLMPDSAILDAFLFIISSCNSSVILLPLHKKCTCPESSHFSPIPSYSHLADCRAWWHSFCFCPSSRWKQPVFSTGLLSNTSPIVAPLWWKSSSSFPHHSLLNAKTLTMALKAFSQCFSVGDGNNKATFCNFCRGWKEVVVTRSGTLAHRPASEQGRAADVLPRMGRPHSEESPCHLRDFLVSSLDITHDFIWNFIKNCSFHKVVSSMTMSLMIFESPLYQSTFFMSCLRWLCLKVKHLMTSLSPGVIIHWGLHLL